MNGTSNVEQRNHQLQELTRLVGDRPSSAAPSYSRRGCSSSFCTSTTSSISTAAASSGQTPAIGTHFHIATSHNDPPPTYDGKDKSLDIYCGEESFWLSFLIAGATVHFSARDLRLKLVLRVQRRMSCKLVFVLTTFIARAKSAWYFINEAITDVILKQRIGHTG